jgi:hypothetical protein
VEIGLEQALANMRTLRHRRKQAIILKRTIEGNEKDKREPETVCHKAKDIMALRVARPILLAVKCSFRELDGKMKPQH